MSELRRTPQGEAPGDRGESPLSSRHAFVVQFREEMGATPRRFTGRVEHMTSGRATRFSSPTELLAFFAQILTPTREKPP